VVDAPKHLFDKLKDEVESKLDSPGGLDSLRVEGNSVEISGDLRFIDTDRYAVVLSMSPISSDVRKMTRGSTVRHSGNRSKHTESVDVKPACRGLLLACVALSHPAARRTSCGALIMPACPIYVKPSHLEGPLHSMCCVDQVIGSN
jgi:hypothetical protein